MPFDPFKPRTISKKETVALCWLSWTAALSLCDANTWEADRAGRLNFEKAMKTFGDRPWVGGWGFCLFSFSSHKYLKQPRSLTAVLNGEVEDIAGGVAPIHQHIADLHIVDVSCWCDRHRWRNVGSINDQCYD